MKKIIFGIFMVLTIVLITSCLTNNIVYDRKIPAEETCILRIPENYTVVNFNGKSVKWKTSIWGFNLFPGKSIAAVKIPAGEHTIIVNYKRQTQIGDRIETQMATGISVTYEYEAGNTYSLMPMIFGNTMIIRIRKH